MVETGADKVESARPGAIGGAKVEPLIRRLLSAGSITGDGKAA